MRAILVSGGGAGIGRSVVTQCAARGDAVAILDIDASAARQSAEAALAAGAPAAVGLECDVSREDQVADAFGQAVNHVGPLWGAFANAGVDMGGFIHELPYETWRRVLDTNLTGIFLTCKYTLQNMMKEGTHGSIVCTSSPGA